MDQATKVAEKLLEIKAVQINQSHPFIWSSGLQSPIYCDNRVILSYPNVRNFIKKKLFDLAQSLGSFEYVAGVATAGIPFGALLADDLDLPFIYVRPTAKEHGKKNQVEGRIEGTPNVLVVEDLISTGGSSIKVVKVLRDLGCTCDQVISIFNYALPVGEENFRNTNCSIYSLCDYPRLIEVALDKGYVAEQEIASLEKWRLNPLEWKK